MFYIIHHGVFRDMSYCGRPPACWPKKQWQVEAGKVPWCHGCSRPLGERVCQENQKDRICPVLIKKEVFEVWQKVVEKTCKKQTRHPPYSFLESLTSWMIALISSKDISCIPAFSACFPSSMTASQPFMGIFLSVSDIVFSFSEKGTLLGIRVPWSHLHYLKKQLSL